MAERKKVVYTDENDQPITDPKEGDIGYLGTAKFYFVGGKWISEGVRWRVT